MKPLNLMKDDIIKEKDKEIKRLKRQNRLLQSKVATLSKEYMKVVNKLTERS